MDILAFETEDDVYIDYLVIQHVYLSVFMNFGHHILLRA